MQIKLIGMRKIVVMIAFLGFITFNYAQNTKVRVGLTFANGLSFLNSDNTNVSNTKVGYAFEYGLPVEIQFSENYILATGLIISHPRAGRSNSPAIDSLFAIDARTGTTFTFDNNIVAGANESYRLNYVNLPTTFKLRTNQIGYFRYFGEFGFINSFRVRARLNVNGSEFENESLTKENDLGIKSLFYNASLKVGGGFEYTFSDKTALIVGLHFNNGFVNVLNDGPDEKRTVLRAIYLTTGIMF